MNRKETQSITTCLYSSAVVLMSKSSPCHENYTRPSLNKLVAIFLFQLEPLILRMKNSEDILETPDNEWKPTI